MPKQPKRKKPAKSVVVRERPALTLALEKVRAAVNAVLDLADSAADKLTKALRT